MEQLGDYEYSKKDLIGHGAFAVVFKGRIKKNPECVVAIKSITKKNIAKSQALLSKEIKILKELSSLKHENVVTLMDCKETSNHLYLVMEYCNGGDLADYLQANGTLSEDTIAMFLTQIAGAMKALYSMGIVHRDLKPQNLLLSYSTKDPKPSDYKIKIADFGFARFLQDGVMAVTLCGSPMYMAPEVIMSQQYDAKADLWSIGTIIYQALTGKAPFQATTPQQLKTYYERTPNLQPSIPSGTSHFLRDLLLRLLKRNASDRIEFSAFFDHPFVTKYAKPKTSVPVAVPLRGSDATDETDSAGSASTSSLRTLSVSPLSAAPIPTPPQHTSPVTSPLSKSKSDIDDYVMVPGNCPADETARIMDQARESQQHLSSSRPSSLQVVGSAPISVPVQRRDFDGTIKASDSPKSPARLRNNSARSSGRSRASSECSANMVDIGSLTPPNITFAVGTPPAAGGFVSKGSMSRPRSQTDVSLKQHPSNSNPVSAAASNRLSGQVTDLLRRPSFVQVDHKDAMNKENCPSSVNPDLSSPTTITFAQSPSNMEGPVLFYVPELKSETLMGTEHTETLSKLRYICSLTCCLSDLAQSRSSPLLDSPRNNKLAGCVVFVSEKQRRIEQLVLYIRALHILSSSLQFAKDEVTAGRLMPSPSVKQVIKELNGYYHSCLDKSKLLKSKGVDMTGAGVDQQFLNNTADKLIYEHAVELCQLAALDELYGNRIECVKRYQGAHVLLHSLAQMADLMSDRELLNANKAEVEKRLVYLESQGYCVSVI